MLTAERTRPTTLSWRVAVALASVYVIWGSTYLAIKFTVAPEHGAPIPPMLMAAMRFGLSGALLLAWAVRRPAADGLPDPIGWPQLRSTLIVALALLIGGNGLVVLAETRGLDSGITAVIVASVPLWAALIGAVRRDKPLPPIGLFGVALGFAGVAALFWPTADAEINTVAALMVVVGALCWASGSYYSRGAPLPRRPLVMTAIEMLWGALAFVLLAAARGEFADFAPRSVSAHAWWALVYLTVIGGMVAFTAYVWLLRNAPMSLATTYAYVNPVVAVFLGWLFANEKLTLRDLIATAVIVTSVALILSTHRPAPTRA
ncbi:MAG: EamA family transporter [Mycobacteriales bacterium]